MTIDVDPSGAIAALERLGPAVEVRLDAVARDTAERIAAEARRRVRRRTGQTAAGITVEQAKDGNGYVVFVDIDPARWPNLDIGLEFGTRFMGPAPFLHASAVLEESSHRRRLEHALQDAIDEVGGRP